MNILYVLDNNYIDMAKMSIASVLKFNPNARIIILTTKSVNLPYEQIQIDIKGVNWRHRKEDRFGDDVYLKLYAPKLYELIGIEKAIYLDADVICKGSLQELWDMPCKYIGAVESHVGARSQVDILDIPHYYNAGVLLMNLKTMYKHEFTKRAINWMWNIDVPLWCHDETIINAGFNSLIKMLPVCYNYCYNRKYEEKIEDAKLVHFVNQEKKHMKSFYEGINGN